MAGNTIKMKDLPSSESSRVTDLIGLDRNGQSVKLPNEQNEIKTEVANLGSKVGELIGGEIVTNIELQNVNYAGATSNYNLCTLPYEKTDANIEFFKQAIMSDNSGLYGGEIHAVKEDRTQHKVIGGSAKPNWQEYLDALTYSAYDEYPYFVIVIKKKKTDDTYGAYIQVGEFTMSVKRTEGGIIPAIENSITELNNNKIGDAPKDGNDYVRNNGEWKKSSSSYTKAESDAKYANKEIETTVASLVGGSGETQIELVNQNQSGGASNYSLSTPLYEKKDSNISLLKKSVLSDESGEYAGQIYALTADRSSYVVMGGPARTDWRDYLDALKYPTYDTYTHFVVLVKKKKPDGSYGAYIQVGDVTMSVQGSGGGRIGDLEDDMRQAQSDISSLGDTARNLTQFRNEYDGDKTYIDKKSKIASGGYRVTNLKPSIVPQCGVIATLKITGLNAQIQFCDNNWRSNAEYIAKDGAEITINLPADSTHMIVATEDGSSVSADVDFRLTIKYNSRYELFDSYRSFVEKRKLKSIISTLARGNASINGSPSSSNPLVLACITDIHNDDSTTKKFLALCEDNKDYIDDILGIGDYVQTDLTNAYALGDLEGFDKVLKVVGNHDAYEKYSASAPTIATEERVFDLFFANDVSKWGVNYTPDKCFFYKDYVAENIRVVCVDCMHWDESSDSNGQIAWLRATLASARASGYHVMIVSHISFTNSNTGSLIGFDRCAFVEKDKDDITKQNDYISMAVIVDEFQQAGGEFICYVFGHAHIDYMGTFENYPNQISIVQACTGGLGSWRDNSWTTDSIWDLRFNMMSIDSTKKYIRIYRVGEDFDRNMQKKVSALISYDKSKPQKFII